MKIKKIISTVLIFALILNITACQYSNPAVSTNTPRTTTTAYQTTPKATATQPSTSTPSPTPVPTPKPEMVTYPIEIGYIKGQNSTYGTAAGKGSHEKGNDKLKEITFEATPKDGCGFLYWSSDTKGQTIYSYYNPYTYSTEAEPVPLYPVFIKGTQKVALKDKAVKAVVEEQLGKSTYTYADLQKIEELDLGINSPQTAEDFVYFYSLKGLYIHPDKDYFDISPIANLVNITNISLGVKLISTLPFENYKNLKNLYMEYSGEDASSLVKNKDTLESLTLAFSNIKKFEFLSEMHCLKRLNLTDTVIKESDLDYLPPSLEYLRLDGCENVKDYSRLERLPNLTELGISSSWVSDITSIGKLKHLKELFAGGNYITDVSPLARLTNLEDLDIGLNRITDLSPLKSFFAKSDTEIILELNPIKDYSFLYDYYPCKFYGIVPNEKLAEAVEVAKDMVKELIKPNMSDYDKYKALAIGLCDKVNYDYAGEEERRYDLYGTLVKGLAVCSGYMEAYMMLCTMAGLPCYWIFGLGAGGPHGWNIVKLDGKYYHVDTTWMDVDVPDKIFMEYFMKSDEFFLMDHSDFNRAPDLICNDTSRDGDV